MSIRLLDAHIRAIQDYFAEQPDVELAYLFGSYTRNDAGPLSDVDVAVLLPRHLDRKNRFRNGRLLFCRDEDIRIQFEAATVTRYLDFQPVLERHNQAILRQARNGELFRGSNSYHAAFERHRQFTIVAQSENASCGRPFHYERSKGAASGYLGRHRSH